MIELLLLALGVVVFLFYVCCYSPPAQKIGDKLLPDPMIDRMGELKDDQ